MKEEKRKRRMSYSQILALGFFLVILAGAILLSLPIAARNGQSTNFLDCLFTATTSTCVTGLIVVDTFQHWSLFGQWVILFMIQIGGMGFVTLGVIFSMFLRRKISLKDRRLLQDSINALQLGGVVRLIKKISKGVLFVELSGAVLLSIRFIPEFGFAKGIYYSIFHAVSAFCNAGMDLMGVKRKYCSLMDYSADWLVNLTVMSLIVIGGIGFVVWDDVSKKKWHFKKYLLHTKIVLSSTAVLLFGSALLFYLFEKDNLMKDMSASEIFLTSMFSSVTARTAGFNTIDTGALSGGSKILTSLLMFIGGSPGSTAGGIKTVTAVVLLLYLWSNIRLDKQPNIFQRRITDEVIKKACTVLCISLTLSMCALLGLCALHPKMAVEDLIFEVYSALGTVGMTTGITRGLGAGARVILIVLMYCGRLGSMSFAMTFVQSRKSAPLKQPAEKIMIG